MLSFVLFLQKYTTVHSDSKQSEEYFESIFEIFTPTNYGLIKGLSTDQDIYSIFSIEMYHYIVRDSSMLCKEYLERISGYVKK